VKKLTISKTRSAFYKSAKSLGDINAIKNNKIGQRITNRLIGNASQKISTRLSKSVMKLFK